MVFITHRVHPFPFRTRKLSCAVPKILDWKRSGKIGRGQHQTKSIDLVFLFHRKLRKVLKTEKRCDIMMEQKDSGTKRGGDNTSKNDIFAITFKTWRRKEVCVKGGRGPFKQKK